MALSHPWTMLGTMLGLLLALAPLLAFGFAGERIDAAVQRLNVTVQVLWSMLFALPYFLACAGTHGVSWRWGLLYLAVPPAVAGALALAARLDPAQRGHWLDFTVLVALGLAVDLRWLEPAWPPGTTVIGKLVLLDAGLYGFLGVRKLRGVGYDLRLRWSDGRIGLREFAFYAPLAIGVGLALGFLHLHTHIEHPWRIVPAWVFTFIAVALPEEVFFRGWMQNLLERRMGRRAALVTTAILFGLSHFNKHTAFFNWKYVLLAALAGIFYGRAWRRERRIGASAITHATVDTVWGVFLR